MVDPRDFMEQRRKEAAARRTGPTPFGYVSAPDWDKDMERMMYAVRQRVKMNDFEWTAITGRWIPKD